jgi:subtilase family serine protease
MVLMISGSSLMAFAAETRVVTPDEIRKVKKARPQKTRVNTHHIKKPKPDLTITDMKIIPAAPKKGITVKFSAKVINKGLVDAPWHQAAIRVGGETHPPPISVHVLAPNASQAITRYVLMNQPGKFQVMFIADASGSVAESNENNNSKYTEFTVKDRLPDLTLVDSEFSPTNPKVGDTVRVQATAKNIGDITAGFFHNGIRVGGQSQPDIIGSVGHLDVTTPQSQKHVVARQWYPAQPGTYIVRLYIDVNNEVAELKENNNMVSFTITVAP